MDKAVEVCKSTWRSLRDSMRYHTSAKKKRKSGSAADLEELDSEVLLDESERIDWEFFDSMSFLTPVSSQKKRRTYNSISEADDSPSCSTYAGEHTQTDSPTPSNYAYLNENRKKEKDPLLETAATLSSSIQELIQFQKSKVDPPTPQLKHYTMLANWDRMLQKLPEDVVEELNAKFTWEIHQEIKKINNEKKNSDKGPSAVED